MDTNEIIITLIHSIFDSAEIPLIPLEFLFKEGKWDEYRIFVFLISLRIDYVFMHHTQSETITLIISLLLPGIHSTRSVHLLSILGM